jgi:hypothetical protein
VAIDAAQPAGDPPADATHPVAARRILRLALGSGLCLAVTQAFAWPLAFIAPVLTLMLLSLPLPAPSVRQGIAVVLALVLPMIASLALLPFLSETRWAGILLLALALFFTFLYTARGGKPILGATMTVGLTLVVTIGSVSPELLALLVPAMGFNALAGVFFVWVAHLLLPDRTSDRARLQPPPAAAPLSPRAAARSALRSLAIVLPLALVFLFSSASTAYTPVMIKVASLGQQASADHSARMGRSLFMATLWGGVAAAAVWSLLRIWPGLVPYTLAVALAALLLGRRIFSGRGLAPEHDVGSYALLTLLILLGPSVGDPVFGGGLGFLTRLGLFLLIAVYGTVAVAVFDAFWPERQEATTASRSQAPEE